MVSLIIYFHFKHLSNLQKTFEYNNHKVGTDVNVTETTAYITYSQMIVANSKVLETTGIPANPFILYLCIVMIEES